MCYVNEPNVPKSVSQHNITCLALVTPRTGHVDHRERCVVGPFQLC